MILKRSTENSILILHLTLSLIGIIILNASQNVDYSKLWLIMNLVDYDCSVLDQMLCDILPSDTFYISSDYSIALLLRD